MRRCFFTAASSPPAAAEKLSTLSFIYTKTASRPPHFSSLSHLLAAASTSPSPLFKRFQVPPPHPSGGLLRRFSQFKSIDLNRPRLTASSHGKKPENNLKKSFLIFLFIFAYGQKKHFFLSFHRGSERKGCYALQGGNNGREWRPLDK